MNRGMLVVPCIVICLLMNVLCFLLMGIDKRRARKGAYRIPEATLFLTAALFGATGGTIAMKLFRHKTRHLSFRIAFPAMMVLQWLLMGMLIL